MAEQFDLSGFEYIEPIYTQPSREYLEYCERLRDEIFQSMRIPRHCFETEAERDFRLILRNSFLQGPAAVRLIAFRPGD